MKRRLKSYEEHLIRRIAAERTGSFSDPVALNLMEVEDVEVGDPAYHHINISYQGEPFVGAGYMVLGEWVSSDQDGGIIELLVLGDATGRPHDLEICRPDRKPIICLPAVEQWRMRRD